MPKNKKEVSKARRKKSPLWSVRMRASRKVTSQKSKVKSSKNSGIHISGAEGLYEFPEIDTIMKGYFLRAMNHTKGNPDNVVMTIERIKQKPLVIPLLPVTTVQCYFPIQALTVIRTLLSDAGISDKSIKNGIKVVTGGAVMHGASLILSESGIRVEPDKKRGVRVSKLGIHKDIEKPLSLRLAKKGINNTTVKEAIILASKVASCRGVVAELCISDNPDYTIGYIASKELGYVRIPNIKKKGSIDGGRVFFIKENSDIKRIIEYLERTPVVAGI